MTGTPSAKVNLKLKIHGIESYLKCGGGGYSLNEMRFAEI